MAVMPRFLRAATFIAALSATSCSSSTELEEAVVEGKVSLRGQPLKAGQVSFVHASGRPHTADIQPDGSFKLKVRVGPTQVAVESREPDRPNPDGWPTKIAGKRLTPEKYASHGSSGLTFDVRPKHNVATFDLMD
jgi:hypothetical protein